MKTNNEELIDWAINKIETEYKDEVSLLIGQKGAFCRLPQDGNEEVSFNFFIPASDHGYELAQVFIINGISSDLFPMSWERVEGLANINESLTFCLADGEILYARNEEEKERFIQLQQRFHENLNNSTFAFNKALEKINTAMELFKTMMFEKSLSHVRKGSGNILGYLTEAIATVNATYLKKGQENRIAALKEMKKVPQNFIQLYLAVISAHTIEELKELCYQILDITREFFSNYDTRNKTSSCNLNFQDLAGWYEESSYTWRRIYYYCDQKDFENSFAWGCYLQIELDIIKEEFGLETMDLLGVFDAEDLTIFRNRAEYIEQYVLTELKKQGVALNVYADLEEFLKKQD